MLYCADIPSETKCPKIAGPAIQGKLITKPPMVDANDILDDLQYFFEGEKSDKYERMESIIQDFKKTCNKQWVHQLNDDEAKRLCDIIYHEFDLSEQIVFDKRMEVFEEYNESYPPSRIVVIEPINETAKLIKINFNDIIESGEYSC